MSNEFKGTKGPWRIDDNDPTFQHVASDTYHQIRGGDGHFDRVNGSGFGISGILSIHDANLIAAAPDILEALQDMLSGWKYIRDQHGDLYGVGWDRAQDKANTAINKALGVK